MVNKEKMIQIYEILADITLANLKKAKEAETFLDEDDLQMVSATLTLYSAIAEDHPAELFPYHPVSAHAHDEVLGQ